MRVEFPEVEIVDVMLVRKLASCDDDLDVHADVSTGSMLPSRAAIPAVLVSPLLEAEDIARASRWLVRPK